MGSDFDNAEDHLQDTSKFKVKTGFDTIDHMLGGGWDIQTLNIVMAETNGGKCTFFDTDISIRCKSKNNIYSKKIGSFFAEVRKGYNNI
jgi:replicative DNA helicase